MPSKVTNSYLPFEPFIWHLAHGRTLTVGPKAVVMGILNVTPDSFSDGGKYDEIDKAIKQAKKMLRQGAQIIDVGGESTRPDAANVSAKEEQKRVLPIIEALSDISECIISIDTYKASTAKLAIKKGAHIVNDVWGLQFDPKMASTINALKAGCVLMHTGRQRTKNEDVMQDQMEFLQKTLSIAKKEGVLSEQIVLDPGFGFAKNTQENVELLSKLEQLLVLNQPILTGTSNKRFIGDITGRAPKKRDTATSATNVIARLKGSALFRVHDVAKNVDALQIADAILASK